MTSLAVRYFFVLSIWLLNASIGTCKELNAVVVLYQEDEHEVLADWIAYHGPIFGYDRLYIVDHSSKHTAILNLLKAAQKMGVTVTRDDRSMLDKEFALSEVMHQALADHPDVDLVIPLDADEFIVAEDPNRNGYTAEPEAIRAAFASLPYDGWKYKFANVNARACPADSLYKDARRVFNAMLFEKPKLVKTSKTFFPRDEFVNTDAGNHHGRVKKDADCGQAPGTKTALPNPSGRRLLQDQAVGGGDGVSSPADEIEAAHGVTNYEGVCFHKTKLALIHYGYQALSVEAYKAKVLRAMAAHDLPLEGECEGRGAHYCILYHGMMDDEEKFKKDFEEVVCKPGFEHSEFMAAAVMGERSLILEYPEGVELV